MKFAFRTLLRAPVFTATVIAALAFCIGLNTAIFSVVDTVLFRPLPFPDQESLVAVTEGVPGLGFPVLPFSPPDYLFVAANTESFSSTAVYRNRSYEISGVDQSQRVSGARVTASLFEVLGVSPAIGRAFTPAEDEHTERVVVLSSGLAESAFGTTERAVGRTVLLNRIPYTVIGVMPRSFSFPIRGSRFNGDPADVFMPVSWSDDERQQNVSNFDYSMVARLKPEVTIQQASLEIEGLLERIVEDYPPKIKQALQSNPNFSLESQIAPFREEFTGDVRHPLLLLLASVGVVLLIGCADVANLIFSRMVGRQREFALRSALGATGWRLARQTIIEGLVLSVAGGVAGFCIAFWALPLLIRFAPDNLPRLAEIGLNWRVAAFVAVVTLSTPLVFCLGPLGNIFRSAFMNQLRGEGRTATQGRHQRLVMSAGVVSQFSLAFVLLATAGLLTRSLVKASEANPGFRPEHVVRAQIALPESVYQTRAQVSSFFDRLLSQVSTLPSVRQTGAISDIPTGSTTNVVISIEGRPDTVKVDTLFCHGNALESLGIRLLRGRMLRPDDQIGEPRTAVVSESLAKQAWPGQDPIGRRIRFGVSVPNNQEPWLTVVGVVADVKARLTSNTPRFVLFTTAQEWVRQMNVVVRTSGDPLALTSAIQDKIAQLDASLPVGKIETLDQVLEGSLSAERFRTWLLVCFATAALLLATLGIAGLLAYNAAQRRQEFGLRIALGADRRALIGLVLRHCLRLSGTGIAVGLAASIATTRALSSLLYETSPLDPGTFIAVALVLLLVALGAAMLPAWRVARTDPITALRAE
jgi:predicted permease